MKLTDFSKDDDFNKLRKMMGASLSDYTFKGNWNPSTINSNLDIYGEDEVSFNLLTVEDDKTITLSGRRVLVYIRDQQAKYYKKYKFHLANCSTLVKYQAEERYDKYVISIKSDGVFKVNVIHENGDIEKGKYEKLPVCKNCLSTLNYKGSNLSYNRRNNVCENFDLDEFFKLYNHQNIAKPSKTDASAPLNAYPTDWNAISLNYRRRKNFHCEQCKVDLTINPKYLHVHHINGLKYQCGDENLLALCLKCHAEQDGHGHLFAHSDYNAFIAKYPEL